MLMGCQFWKWKKSLQELPMAFNINNKHIWAQVLISQVPEFMITLVNYSSFRCVERINDSAENLLTIYWETDLALQ